VPKVKACISGGHVGGQFRIAAKYVTTTPKYTYV